MGDEYLGQKFKNCIKWMCRTMLKYGPDDSPKKIELVRDLNGLTSNEQALANCTNPLMLNAFVSQIPQPFFDKLVEARHFYYMTEQERVSFLKNNCADFRKTLEALTQAVDYFESVIETEGHSDLRMLGGYIEIFFGAFISNRLELQNQKQKKE
jgi:hypothetical protein